MRLGTVIYLNNAAESFPKAPGVVAAVQRALESPPCAPARASGQPRDPARACRALVAQLLHADDPSRVVMTTSGTHGLNLAICGVAPWKNPRLLTSVMDHNSVLRPMHALAARRSGAVEVLACRAGALDEEQFDRALQRGVDVIAITHASNVTGAVFEVASLFKKAKAAGAYTVLDACQTAGLEDIDPRAMHADMVAFSAHKAVHGPPGAGALWVAPGIDLDPVMTGGTGILSQSLSQPSAMPVRMEAGTPNAPALSGFAAALGWASENVAARYERVQALRALLLAKLTDLPGVTVYDAAPGSRNTGIVSLRLRGWSTMDVGFALQESFGISVRAGLHCAPLAHAAIGAGPDGTVRLSVSSFSTEHELDGAVGAIGRLAG